MEPVYLALGSNLGDREGYLRAAGRGLAARGIEIVRSASVYSTEPREVLDQPWFLNTVLQVSTDLGPTELLRICLQIEEKNNRRRDTAKGPRTIDIDIIFYGNRIIRNPGLAIPHPRFSARRFVLLPLTEIAAAFVDPLSGRTIRQLFEICDDPATVVRVSDALVFSHPSPNARQ
jgi:2-amino-4-hydroxy-6-hydroxymethyldihydropteridine diphosphokinase